jgi:hypothetical protein
MARLTILIELLGGLAALIRAFFPLADRHHYERSQLRSAWIRM